ncbi:MAG: fasciclin domain-containing protein [Lysobacterales bacterium]|nr:MAG: fasciclin domain-containing protein [Xanthomonadales bacterium]
MYKTWTSSKALLNVAALALAFTLSTSVSAGPGKPGQNDIVEGGTIVDIALAVNDGGAGEFNGLLSAVLCFGPVDDNPIVDLLSGTDKYTLFAPTDAAFDALLDRLGETDPCDLNPNTLLAVLQYHVVDGRRFSNSLFNINSSKVIETLAGADIVSFVDEVEGPKLHDVDGQMVGVVEDLININAINGVIHVIDTVLLPIDLP